MTLSTQHESTEGWQAINPITGQRCINDSSDSWKVRYAREREEKVSSYMWKRGINGLPESISKSKARKEAEHDSSQAWKPEYSPLLHFHRHDKTKAGQEHVLPCTNGREESTAVEIKLVAQLQANSEQRQSHSSATQWEQIQLGSHFTFCCKKGQRGGQGRDKAREHRHQDQPLAQAICAELQVVSTYTLFLLIPSISFL